MVLDINFESIKRGRMLQSLKNVTLFSLTYFFFLRSAGKTNVALSFSCEFSTSGSNTQPRFYSSSLSVKVVPDLPLALGVPITWILPPHYTSTSLLPLSAESYLDIQNRKGTISYSLLRNVGEKNGALHKDYIFIDGDRIKTTVGDDLACIQAKDHTTGRTEIASCVKVAEVCDFSFSSFFFFMYC